MTRRLIGSALWACLLGMGLETALPGQTIAGYGGLTAGQTMTKQTERILNFYGRNSASMASLGQIPMRPKSPSAAAWRLSPTKPFVGGKLRSPVTPYLNLFRDDESEAAPNYFAIVRPQMRQQDINQRQQVEIQRLHRQIQTASASLGITPRGNGAMPSTGHSTRFMNTGAYYKVVR